MIQIATPLGMKIQVCQGLIFAAVVFENMGMSYWSDVYQQAAIT
jgi:hypothetical protein